MSCFTKKQVENKNFPILSESVKELKTTEGGASAVCQVMQHYEKIARDEGIAYGMQQGMQQGRVGMLISLVSDGILSPAEAARRAGMSTEEFKAEMLKA